jgi:hypothetical protein
MPIKSLVNLFIGVTDKCKHSTLSNKKPDWNLTAQKGHHVKKELNGDFILFYKKTCILPSYNLPIHETKYLIRLKAQRFIKI